MHHIAIIGSGPAGFYTAEAALKAFPGAQVDILDRLPTPYGLIRAGVAPDHQSIKAVAKRYEATAAQPGVAFLGHVEVGTDVTIDELLGLYHAVVLATGAPLDRTLGIPGETLPGVLGSAAFVGWYNGHPEFVDLRVPLGGPGAVVIGNGNVAIDVARILAKSPGELAESDIGGHALAMLETATITDIHLLGRRGPYQASFTPKEMGELGHLDRATPRVRPGDLPDVAGDAALDPGLRKVVGHLRAFAEPRAPRPLALHIDFFSKPVAIEGDGRVERLIVERTRLEGDAAVGTGEFTAIPCGLVVSCIGYRTAAVPGVPHDERGGRFANDDGRIAPGLYTVGWAQHGPRGTIGTNRPDAVAIVEAIRADAPAGERPGRHGLSLLLAARGKRPIGFDGWRRIEAAEIAAARPGSPREKLVRLEQMLGAAG